MITYSGAMWLMVQYAVCVLGKPLMYRHLFSFGAGIKFCPGSDVTSGNPGELTLRPVKPTQENVVHIRKANRYVIKHSCNNCQVLKVTYKRQSFGSARTMSSKLHPTSHQHFVQQKLNIWFVPLK